jgi:hypothetical protein
MSKRSDPVHYITKVSHPQNCEQATPDGPHYPTGTVDLCSGTSTPSDPNYTLRRLRFIVRAITSPLSPPPTDAEWASTTYELSFTTPGPVNWSYNGKLRVRLGGTDYTYEFWVRAYWYNGYVPVLPPETTGPFSFLPVADISLCPPDKVPPCPACAIHDEPRTSQIK